MHACMQGHSEVVALLLRPLPTDDSMGIEFLTRTCIQAYDNTGHNALHLAVQNGHLNCVHALIAAGVKINAVNAESYTALHYAVDVNIARALIDAKASHNMNLDNETPTTLACRDPRRIDVLRLLLERFPDSEPENWPYLIVAAEEGNLEAMRVLLSMTIWVRRRYVSRRRLCASIR
jgi:ankyrin repeat protein